MEAGGGCSGLNTKLAVSVPGQFPEEKLLDIISTPSLLVKSPKVCSMKSPETGTILVAIVLDLSPSWSPGEILRCRRGQGTSINNSTMKRCMVTPE
jgi:hypothetical protein